MQDLVRITLEENNPPPLDRWAPHPTCGPSHQLLNPAPYFILQSSIQQAWKASRKGILPLGWAAGEPKKAEEDSASL